MQHDLVRILDEIEDIIEEIADYKVTFNERIELTKLFRLKIKQAKQIHSKCELKLVG